MWSKAVGEHADLVVAARLLHPRGEVAGVDARGRRAPCGAAARRRARRRAKPPSERGEQRERAGEQERLAHGAARRARSGSVGSPTPSAHGPAARRATSHQQCAPGRSPSSRARWKPARRGEDRVDAASLASPLVAACRRSSPGGAAPSSSGSLVTGCAPAGRRRARASSRGTAGGERSRARLAARLSSADRPATARASDRMSARRSWSIADAQLRRWSRGRPRAKATPGAPTTTAATAG